MQFITPVEITPGSAGSWQDVDVSSYVPSGATGVVLHIVNKETTISIYAGYRKNGSTDAYKYQNKSSHFWTAVGVDGSRILELYIGDTTYIDVYLVGYYTSDAVFFTNNVDKSISATLAWTDIDISSNTGTDTAIGAIVKIICTNTSIYTFGLRKNGSSDNRVKELYYQTADIIGVDGSEILEGYISNTYVDFYLLGYIISDSTFNTNATDVSLSSTGAWTDLSALPSGAIGGYIEATRTPYSFGLRKKGTSESIYYAPNYGLCCAIVEADSSRIIEGKISSTTLDFFLVGYPTAVASGQTSTVTDTLVLTESVTSLRSLLSSISDTLHLTESQSALRALLLSISDTIGLTEAISVLKGLVVSVSETLHLNEVATALKAVLIEVSENISLTETLTALRARIASVTDSINITEALSAIRARLVSVSDSLHLSEVANAFKAIFVSVSDSLHLAEAMTALRSRIASVTDNISLSGAITSFRNRLASVTDSISLSETLTSLRARISSVTDNLHITENLSAFRGMIVSIADNIGLTEVVTATWSAVAQSIVKSKQFILKLLRKSSYTLKQKTKDFIIKLKI
jgi:hypothetical protein